MLTPEQLKRRVSQGLAVTLAFVGDSTTGGFGATAGPNVWTNGNPYGCVNTPFGPNWDQSSPYALNLTGVPSQSQQDNLGIPSAVRLLRSFLEGINPSSHCYNFGGSGFKAADHVASGMIAGIAALMPKPDAVFIALGINSAKANQGQDADLRTLVSQCIAHDMLPVLVKEHNPGVAYFSYGDWSATATPNQWFPMDNWPTIRANIDQIASDYGIEVIDCGTLDCQLDVTLLYDPFHPSAKGYRVIFERYKTWLGVAAVRFVNECMARISPDGAIRFVAGGVKLSLPVSEGGALRIKTSVGVICAA